MNKQIAYRLRTTRFWITLQREMDLVLKNFERMHGDEFLLPKIPSVRILDLAIAMAPNLMQKIIGIRPGERIREAMCPADDSHLTLEFDDNYVIRPTITFAESNNNYSPNKLDEEGASVQQGFEYNSGRIERFLSVSEIAEFNNLAGAQ